ncbi:response regulator [Polyangium spumosum]|uniref:Response regulator n=1 Tax=Polyangium spumosum TaxID=889282 RepID=A0A6N7PXE6_9BACT|nr:response regulator [Polyangium spumosum]MRG96559.1 response regulator [Polyangium spumosum]
MVQHIIIALIDASPSAMWVLLVVWLVLRFEKPIRSVLPRVTGVSIFGVEASFVREEMDKAIVRKAAPVCTEDRERALRRLMRAESVFRDAAILWVDSAPELRADERALLRFAGASVDVARSTAEALSRLENRGYDAIVSDMKREGDPDAGLSLLSAMRERSFLPPVIFYVDQDEAGREVPPRAFDLTDRPDVLLHALADALERRRS